MITPAGQKAAEACAAKAEATTGFDRQKAAALMKTFLAYFSEATGEQLVDACKASGMNPHNDKAFGGVIRGLSKRKEIVAAGTAPRTKGHGSNGATIWRLSSSTLTVTHDDRRQS